ncbi:MAG TPA: hypothetical protein VEC99_08700, partial [Clostridia bacterium]|nr:hypothetical protein [Clostridia bacterium]
VIIRERRNMFFLDFSGKLLVRFKKLGRRFEVSNIPTKQQLQLLNQQFEFEGIPHKVPVLNAGYQLDGFQTSISRMLVTLQEGRDVVWTYPLPESDEALSVEVTPFQPKPPAPPKVRVRENVAEGNTSHKKIGSDVKQA